MRKGFSIIEMLIAVLLATCIVYVAFSYFIHTRKSWHDRLALLAMQDEANLILNMLRSDIKQAGYIGCPALTQDFIIAPSGQTVLNAKNRIVGTRTGISCTYANPRSSVLVKNTNHTYQVNVSHDYLFHVGEWLIISDCRAAEIIQIQKINHSQHQQILLASHPLQFQFKSGAEVAELIKNNYSYIGEDNIIYFQSARGKKDHLSSGLFSLHFHYYYQQQGQLKYHHHTLNKAIPRLLGVAVRLTAPYVHGQWFIYVPT